MFQTVRHLLCVLAASWEYFAFQHLSSIFFTLGPMKSHSHSQVCRLVGSVLRAPEVQKDSECYLAHSVQYHTVYVKRCKNHCGASQNIQQAQGRQNPQGAWQYDPGGDFNDDNIDLGGSYNGVDQQHFNLGVSHPYQQQCGGDQQRWWVSGSSGGKQPQ